MKHSSKQTFGKAPAALSQPQPTTTAKKPTGNSGVDTAGSLRRTAPVRSYGSPE